MPLTSIAGLPPVFQFSMKKTIFLLLVFNIVSAQNNEPLRLFKNDSITGHVRNYFMHTDNHNLTNYYANATGTGLDYAISPVKNFHIGIGGIYTLKTFSSDLEKIDPYANKTAKWEYELFDLNHRDEYDKLYRLEKLYLKYQYKNSYVAVGRIPLEYHPLINKSDGRMMGFAFQGLTTHIATDSTLQVTATVINGVSPRGMTEWFSIDEAIGLLNNGYQPNSEKAEYKNHTQDNYIAYAQINKKLGDLTLKLEDTHIDKLINTLWAEALYKKKNFHAGLQYSLQFADNAQNNINYQNRYIQPYENGQVISTSLGCKFFGIETGLAYTHAFRSGRYLFPKELGRDNFYTSISRSRLDGLGNADIMNISLKYNLKEIPLLLAVDATSLFGVDAENYRYNKYGIDDYTQINTRLHYSFHSTLKGLTIDLLYVWKQNKHIHTPTTVFNKSDYSQVNIISNYCF